MLLSSAPVVDSSFIQSYMMAEESTSAIRVTDAAGVSRGGEGGREGVPSDAVVCCV